MASDPSVLDHVLDQLVGLDGISHRRLFGEYALYHRGKVVAFLCDNRLYMKPTAAGRACLEGVTEGCPYPGARPHFLVDDLLDDRERLVALLLATSAELPLPKPKAARSVKAAKPAVLPDTPHPPARKARALRARQGR